MTEREKVTIDEIIGIVKTDGQTNSVQLKKEAQLSVCEKRVLELEKENEQLKSDMRENYKKHKELLDENEHIKQTIQDMIQTERTELEQSVLRQLWEAIQ